jgi:hypothetical protein
MTQKSYLDSQFVYITQQIGFVDYYLVKKMKYYVRFKYATLQCLWQNKLFLMSFLLHYSQFLKGFVGIE